MKRLLFLSLTFALTLQSALAESSDAVSKSDVDALVAPYLKIQQSLAGDDLAGAKKAAASLQTVASEHHVKAVSDSVVQVAEAGEIAAARKAFHEVSKAVIELAEDTGTEKSPDLYVVYCPMAFEFSGATWLQDSRKVANPYFGSQMYSCGSVRQEIAATEEAPKASKPHEHKHGEDHQH